VLGLEAEAEAEAEAEVVYLVSGLVLTFELSSINI